MRKVKRIFLIIFLILISLATLYPVFFIYNNALKTEQEITASLLNFTKSFSFESFKALIIKDNVFDYMLNTALITVGGIVICLFLAILASFRLSRFEIKGGNLLYIFFIFGIILSHVTSIIPIFIILKNLHLINTYLGLMIAFAAWQLSLTILILTAFFRTIPKELQDASKIDGCSDFGFLFRILVPLSKAPIAATVLLGVIFMWNDLLFPMVLGSSPKVKMISLALIQYKGEFRIAYGLLFSAIGLLIIPVIILYILFQRYFVSGSLTGSLIE